MRRRPRAADDPGAPPPALLAFAGSGTREKLAWLSAREQWWKSTHPDNADNLGLDDGGLQLLIDGWDEIGHDLPWCGSLGDPCDDIDCICNNRKET